MERGLAHGTMRRWDSKGNLLGSWEMVHGTGKQFEWYPPDGPLMGEIDFVGGGPHGLQILYNPDGTEWLKKYYYEGVPVSKKTFNKLTQEGDRR